MQNPESPSTTTVAMSCVDDDAQGQPLTVDWHLELDPIILAEEAWKDIGKEGFDPPRQFSAFLNTLRWNCVTATNPSLFQSPFRAGIRIEPYQLDPLSKALQLPRVNLFIADDVGLGKTIEAGLIASELLLRRRVRDIVVVCPPSMLLQWKDEMEQRFGLVFEIFDRNYMERIRRTRGHAVNAWDTFPRFLISQRLLINEAYAGPLRVWLDNLRPGSLLILDEAHHAAPASSSKYAIDSKITRAIRSIAPRFEHRLFLSATPHNGHSNSFSSLLHLLDKERFLPGVPVPPKNHRAVMVRRLKDDLRSIGVPGFPERIVEAVELPKALGIEVPPEQIPEIQLADLLERYRAVRLEHMAALTKGKRASFELLTTRLQQRLLSSVEAFARSLKTHRITMEKIWASEAEILAASTVTLPDDPKLNQLPLGPVSADDELATLPEDELAQQFELETERATLAAANPDASPDTADIERGLLADMSDLAERARLEPDLKARYIVKWIKEHQCAGARLPIDGKPKKNAAWTDTRLIIFTEWDDTRRYLVHQLESAIANTADHEERIRVFHGPTSIENREVLKRVFNAPPDQNPLRILVCTDAAREGLNLQATCHHLFHYDIPWNPARLEQRNGRIDRKLQPAPTVYCRYFDYTERPEDRILRTIARKSQTIKAELGSFTDVVEKRLARGIRRDQIDELQAWAEEQKAKANPVINVELEESRLRHEDLKKRITELDKHLEKSRQAINLDNTMLEDAISCSLELLDVPGLQTAGQGRFELPDLPNSWSATLDTLRPPPSDGRRDYIWRSESPVRPVTFSPPDGPDDSVVQLHLSHRLVKRLLGRYTTLGHQQQLNRACLSTSNDSIPRVALLARLAIYGPGASRLHEEVLTITARWSPPGKRKAPLKPFESTGESTTLQLLEESLHPENRRELPPSILDPIAASISQDVEELLAHLEPRGQERFDKAVKLLTKRGDKEAASLVKILEDQRKLALEQLQINEKILQEEFDYGTDEQRQREADMKYQRDFLENVDDDLEREPKRIREFYTVKAHRIEPVGIVYLWPDEESSS